jgi:hypothetical protein
LSDRVEPGDFIRNIGPNRCFHSTISPLTPVLPGTISDPCKLNRGDKQELLDNQDVLDARTRGFLERVRRKPEIYPERFSTPRYLSNSTILIASSYPGSQRYAYCGVPNEFNLKGTCRDHKFCPYCNYLVREQAVRTFVPAFSNGSWHFLTISFSGQLPFDSANAPSSVDCWDACKNALQHLEQTGIVAGVHWTEEIAIVSFLPLRVIPHIYVVVDASTFSADELELLRQQMTGWHNAQGEGLPLGCNLDVRPVSSERSLFDRVRYLYKPIEIAPRYEAAWNLAAQDDRARAWELNSQAREFAAGVFDIRKDRQRMNSKGTLNPRAREFIGIKKEDRAGYSQYLQELQRNFQSILGPKSS